MKIADNRSVALHYRLTLDTQDGDLVEETFGKDPLKFVFGRGMMLPHFEANLKDLSPGDTFGFRLEAENAYGVHNKELIITVSRERFGVTAEDEIPIGEQVQMTSQDGARHVGTIVGADAENVHVDFNPPMAGKNLFFTGEIVSVAAAPAQ